MKNKKVSKKLSLNKLTISNLRNAVGGLPAITEDATCTCSAIPGCTVELCTLSACSIENCTLETLGCSVEFCSIPLACSLSTCSSVDWC